VKARPTVLAVDDSSSIRLGLRGHLDARGFDMLEAASCSQALEIAAERSVDAVVLDYLLPDGNALEVLPRLKELMPAAPVIVLTGHGSIDLAVRAVQQGADHFLTKPVDLDALQALLQRLIVSQPGRRQGLARSAQKARRTIDPFVGTSPAIRHLAEQARRVLPSDSPILLRGETGSGKGVLAAWLHENGPRRDEAFVDLNCAGLTAEFLGSELLGHERGAFTGATASKLGLVELADRGTLFLDEIADMDLGIQSKLLKVLEDKRVRKLGAVRDRLVDVRLIGASHADIGQLAREKRFRADLYFRISALPIDVPPLRERKDDIPVLAANLLETIASDLGRGEVLLADDAISALQAHSWAGNVRELRNVLERAVLLQDKRELRASDLRFDSAGSGEEEASSRLEDLEQRHIARVLQRSGGKVDAAAEALGIPRSTLYVKIKKYGLAQ
jgi:DNA-binding NtrC family response regulator